MLAVLATARSQPRPAVKLAHVFCLTEADMVDSIVAVDEWAQLLLLESGTATCAVALLQQFPVRTPR